MGTNLTEVLDLFMLLQNDYRLLDLYTSSSASFNTYLEGWLLYAVNDFDICTQTLDYTVTSGSTTGSFSVTLTNENKLLLAQLVVKYWMAKEVQDVLQMNLNLMDHDFKHFAESQNLTEKQRMYNFKREETAQLLVDYGYKHNDWTSWGTQVFGG